MKHSLAQSPPYKSGNEEKTEIVSDFVRQAVCVLAGWLAGWCDSNNSHGIQFEIVLTNGRRVEGGREGGPLEHHNKMKFLEP